VRVRIPQGSGPLAPSKPWRFAERLFLIAGLLAIGFAVYTYAARYVVQVYENRAFDRALAAKHFAPSPPVASTEQHPPTASPKSASTKSVSPQAASPQVVIGRIAIPRGISAMVQEGVDDKTLALAVGHIPWTAMPGETGKNVGLAAHHVLDGGQLIAQRGHVKGGRDHVSGQSQVGRLQLPALKVSLCAQLFELSAGRTEDVEPIRDIHCRVVQCKNARRYGWVAKRRARGALARHAELSIGLGQKKRAALEI